MFKKDADEVPSVQPRTSQSAAGSRTPTPRKGGGPAIIGPSIAIKGDVSGDEDLVIQGRVEGTVELSQHNVTIGPNGRVKADVNGRTVVVEGEVEGDLHGKEQIILRHTAKVVGSISAPRVALEDGAVFRGGIEMDSTAKGRPAGDVGTSAPQEKKTPGHEAPAKSSETARDGGKPITA
jgi:cytoskeletal protein CcmA (bactofilin family)